MSVVDRLNVASDERNHAVWAQVQQTGSKANVCWTLDTKRWKDALFSALR